VNSIIQMNPFISQMNISSRQLDAFLALAQLRSFTLAAQRCHLSQPAFSALIKGLEEELGVRLFDRSTRHVAPTQEGLQFQEAALRIRTDLGEAVQGLRDAASLQRGRVSIALLPSLAAAWLPQLLAGFHARHPGVHLQVADLLSEPCIGLVASGQADWAVASIRADTDALQAEWFCADPLHLVCRSDHPLAAHPAPQLEDVLPHPFIHLARHSSVRQYLELARARSGAIATAMQPVLEVEQLATVMGMVRAGLGISVVPALTLFHFQQPGLATRALAGDLPARDLYVVRQRHRSLSPAAQALYELAMAQRPALPGAAAPVQRPAKPGQSRHR